MSRFDEERRQGEVAMRLLGEINQKDREIKRLRDGRAELLTWFREWVKRHPLYDCPVPREALNDAVAAMRLRLTTSDREGENG